MTGWHYTGWIILMTAGMLLGFAGETEGWRAVGIVLAVIASLNAGVIVGNRRTEP